MIITAGIAHVATILSLLSSLPLALDVLLSCLHVYAMGFRLRHCRGVAVCFQGLEGCRLNRESRTQRESLLFLAETSRFVLSFCAGIRETWHCGRIGQLGRKPSDRLGAGLPRLTVNKRQAVMCGMISAFDS